MWKKWSNGNGVGRTNPKLLMTHSDEMEILSQDSFRRSVHREQRRAERSGRPFALMLVELGESKDAKEILGRVALGLSGTIRETDTQGWYEEGSVLGIIFTELGPVEPRDAAQALQAKIVRGANAVLSKEQLRELKLSLHFFPHDAEQPAGHRCDPLLYPEPGPDRNGMNPSLMLKRSLDIAGSLSALVCLAPALAAISIAVKLTSRGPILFRQERVGRFGRRFTMLKFRSMYQANNQKTHEEYMKRFIEGTVQSGQQVYKLTGDSRVTRVGSFLRRTSLDELPQFLNVLRGDMSLVGPRPPIPYEVERYDRWHKRRFLTVLPGITGLWQVQGRSRVKFDEMVRMDLRYERSRSLWLDIKILLQTPRAVVAGDGAH